MGVRNDELKAILENRRRELIGDVQSKLRDIREGGTRRQLDRIPLESFEISDCVQEDIELNIVQLKGNILDKINEALVRLSEGGYGNCDDCGDEIAESRLRALPFAIRCKDCEEVHEVAAKQNSISRGSAARMLFLSDDEKLERA